jgi:hypothetical protein
VAGYQGIASYESVSGHDACGVTNMMERQDPSDVHRQPLLEQLAFGRVSSSDLIYGYLIYMVYQAEKRFGAQITMSLPDFPCRDAMLTALRPDSELETVRNGLLLEGFQFYFIRHFLFERLSSSYKG